MGSICSRRSEVVYHGEFDMPGVPTHIAEETFRDFKATPSFVPLFLSTQVLRGERMDVGACWLERHKVMGGNFEVLLRKTVTKQSANPFTQTAMTELVESTSRTIPDFVGTYTLVIEPYSDTDESDSGGCRARWTDAIISKGVVGRFLSVFCVPCLKRQWATQTQALWQYYYEEALRRTLLQDKSNNKKSDDDAVEN